MKKLRKSYQIKVTYQGETKIYDSIYKAAKELEISYCTFRQWVAGIFKPSIDIQIEKI